MNKIYTFTQRNTKTKQKENKGTLKFNSVGENKAELYFYGDIVSDSWQSYWYEEDKCPQDIVDFLAELNSYQAIDIYINSGGGSVHGGFSYIQYLETLSRRENSLCGWYRCKYRKCHRFIGG